MGSPNVVALDAAVHIVWLGQKGGFIYTRFFQWFLNNSPSYRRPTNRFVWFYRANEPAVLVVSTSQGVECVECVCWMYIKTSTMNWINWLIIEFSYRHWPKRPSFWDFLGFQREKLTELSENITNFLSMEANSENLSIVSIDKRVTNLQANGSRPSSLLGTVLK